MYWSSNFWPDEQTMDPRPEPDQEFRNRTIYLILGVHT